MPYLTNLRLDPFERTGWPENGTKDGAQEYFGWFQYEFWRFVFVQQEVEKLAMTAIEFPPMQKGASFNLDAVKAKIEEARAAWPSKDLIFTAGEFWRFVFVQQEVAKLAMTAVEFPPMQKGASFNLDAVKAKIEAARAAMSK